MQENRKNHQLNFHLKNVEKLINKKSHAKINKDVRILEAVSFSKITE